MPPAIPRRAVYACSILLAGCDQRDPLPSPREPGPATLTAVGSTARTSLAGHKDTVRVTLRDEAGLPVAGRLVTWTLRTAGAQIRPLQDVTRADGTAGAIWSLAATTERQQVTATSEGSQVDFFGLVPVAAVEVAPSALSMWEGDTTTPQVTVRDAAATILAHAYQWISSDPSVAEIDNGVVVRGKTAGSAVLQVAGIGARLAVTVSPAGTSSAVSGRIGTLEGKPAAPTVEVRYADGTGTGRTVGAADGSFTIILRHQIDPADTSEIAIIPLGPDSLLYHPSVLVLPSTALDTGFTVILIPRQWQIQAGVYQGATVPIDVNLAFQPSGGRSYWSGSNTSGSLFSVRRALWPDSAFPLRVALMARPGEAPFTPEDSTGLWRRLDHMEEILGRDLFLPATANPLSPYLPGRDTVYVSRAVNAPQAGSGGPLVWSLTQYLPRQPVPRGYSWVEQQPVSGGVTLDFMSRIGSPVPVHHEFLHLLGLGHGCGWASAVATCLPGSAGERTADMSMEDVAYYEVFRAVQDRERQLGSRLSLISALLGERVLSLRRAPFPAQNEVQ